MLRMRGPWSGPRRRAGARVGPGCLLAAGRRRGGGACVWGCVRRGGGGGYLQEAAVDGAQAGAAHGSAEEGGVAAERIALESLGGEELLRVRCWIEPIRRDRAIKCAVVWAGR